MTIIVLAGRRIDVADAPIPRFPLDRVGAVREQFDALLHSTGATAVVASGACGADLVALQAATAAHIARRMVLPFKRVRFRALSVTDRPGDWGPIFDDVYAATKASRGIKTLPTTHDDNRDFIRTNRFLIREAQALAQQTNTPAIAAVIMWDGASRGDDDMTAGFAKLAQEAGLPLHTINTLT